MEADEQKVDFDIFRDAKAFIALALFIFGFFSRTVEVFIRRDFGERYFSFERLVLSFLLINLFTFFSTGTNPLTGAITVSNGLMFFSYLFLAVGTYHKIVMVKRNYHADYSVHSYSFGTQWGIWDRLFPQDGFFQKMFPVFTHRFVEPAFVFIVGAILSGFDGALGQYIMFSAFCLFMGMLTYYRMELTRFLDANDAKLAAGANKITRFGNANLRPAAGRGKSARGKSAPKLKPETAHAIHPTQATGTQGKTEPDGGTSGDKTQIAKEWT